VSQAKKTSADLIKPAIILVFLLLLWAGTLVAIFWLVPQEPRFTLAVSDHVLLGFSPDGKTLATLVEGTPGFSGGPIVLWDAETGEKRAVIGDRKNQFRTSIQFSPDGKLLAAREIMEYPKEELKLYDVKTLATHASIEIETPTLTQPRICFSPDARFLALNTREKDKDCVKVWDLTNRQELGTLQSTGWPRFFFPEGKTLVVQERLCIELLNVESGQPQFPWLNGLGPEQASMDGQFVATTKVHETDFRVGRVHGAPVRVWESATQKEILTLHGDRQPIFASDSSFLITLPDSYTDANRLRIWNLVDGKKTADLKVASDSVEAITPISGTNYLAVITDDRLSLLGMTSPGTVTKVKILDSSTGKESGSVIQWNGIVSKVEVSRDATALAIQSRKALDLTVEVWDIPPCKSIKWIVGLLAIPTVLTLVVIRKRWIGVGRMAAPVGR
jgi:WD40 repeat protein